MAMKNPPFDLTEELLNLTTEIGVLAGKAVSMGRASELPVLRRTNRIRTIQGTLAIEQNTLSLEQVTAVLNGKRVLAPPREVAEVKNAYEVYELLDELDPYRMEDLLRAHGIMMCGILEDAGSFRVRPAGVADQAGNILHFGTLPQYIPDLMEELLSWTRTSELHPLIKGSVFHYEFELIHPFLDGNGRIGRLWHTLILSKWEPIFAWLPVESIVHDHQREYYEAIGISNAEGKSNAFLSFMLSVIKEALEEAVQPELTLVGSREAERQYLVLGYLKSHSFIGNAEVRELLGVSQATAGRLLGSMVASGLLRRARDGKRQVCVLAG